MSEARVFEKRVERAKTDIVPPFSDIPFAGFERLARIFQEGHRYGRGNWRKGAFDREFQEQRLSHAIRHLMLWSSGDRSEDHLAKVMWFCAVQMEFEAIEAQPPNSWDADGVDHGPLPKATEQARPGGGE